MSMHDTRVDTTRRPAGDNRPDATGPPSQPAGPTARLAGPSELAGRRVLLVGGRSAQGEGPGLNALASHLGQVAGSVSILPCGSLFTDLVGHRVVGRPDLVIAILPGRGSSLAAVRVAARLGSALLALVTCEAEPSWGEVGTLRRAHRVAVTGPRLLARVRAAGVSDSRIDLWPALQPAALTSFEGIAARTLRAATRSGTGAR